MAFAETAQLIARLSLKDDFTRPLGKVKGQVQGLGQSLGRAGKLAGVAVGAAVTVGAAVIGRSVKSGLDSLAELESATTSVDGAIKQMGLTGQVTSGQIAGWANEIESSIQAAFDDKEITQAATTLIRFGKVTTSNIRPALTVVADLATKTGDVGSASTLLAKALANPTKAAGKLERQGILLTESQQDQIKHFVKAGKVAEAQGVIIAAVADITKDAAKNANGPYVDSLKILQDVQEDAQRALATGFLPVLMEVRDILSTELAKPQTLDNIREFGEGLAGGVKGLIGIAKGLPWQQIGDAFKLLGQGSKAALDLFTGLPPWVQTAVLTGWGLNKLTGGALGGIVGELGKGLIKGVLGMNAGVVNIKAGVVNGAGGAGPGGPGGGSLVGSLVGGIGAGLVAAGGVLALQDIQSGEAKKQRRGAEAASTGLSGFIGRAIEEAIGDPIGDLLNPAKRNLQGSKGSGGSPDDRQAAADRKKSQDLAAAARDKIEAARIATISTGGATVRGIETSKSAITSAQRTAAGDIKGGIRSGDADIVAAIRANRPIITVNVHGGYTTKVTTGGTINRTQQTNIDRMNRQLGNP